MIERGRLEKCWIIEYSEAQQAFKHNSGKWEENTSGWITIAKGVDDITATKFCDYIEDKYNPLPKTNVVISEYQSYIK